MLSTYRNNDFHNNSLVNLSRIILISEPTNHNHAARKSYVDNTIYESTLVRNSRSNDFDNISLRNISEINLLSEPSDDNHVTTKSYTDSLSAIDRNRCDLSRVFNDQRKEFDNSKSTNSDSSTVIKNPFPDEKVSKTKYVDDQLDKKTVLRFNQILPNYLKVSVGSTDYNFTKHDRKQSYYATFLKF